MSNIKVNSNFHTLSDKSLFDNNDKKFQEYRRKWTANPEKGIVEDFPLFLDIEVTSNCNLKCPFCSTSQKMNNKNAYMKFNLYKKIIDEGAEKGLYGCKYNYRGEPLLHKELYSFVEYAKKKGLIDVYFNTNLQLLTENVANKLIDVGLDRISISIEGYKKSVYEKYRVGGSFNKLLKNLEMLIETREKKKVKHPKIRIQSVLISEIIDELDDYKNFWNQFAEEVSYLDCRNFDIQNYDLKTDWICQFLWQRLVVLYDGKVLPCACPDVYNLSLFSDAMIIGNVNEISLESIWKSDYIKTIRKLHKTGNSNKLKMCLNCVYRNNEIK
ncbi:MAG TPA: radical SAM protein [bacterium]|nr:radical SAM protein [bacterium]